MAVRFHIVGIIVLSVSVLGCSQVNDELEPSVEPKSTSSNLILANPENIQTGCFFPDTNIPKSLIPRLQEVLDNNTRRYVPAESGSMRIEPGYFMYDDLEYDRSEETKEAIPRAWDPAIVSHPLSDPFFDHSQPSESVIVSRDATPWMITLYGLMPVFPIYGSEMWELRAEATLDPDTCEATLESLVAGPDEIVLYPEDEG